MAAIMGADTTAAVDTTADMAGIPRDNTIIALITTDTHTDTALTGMVDIAGTSKGAAISEDATISAGGGVAITGTDC